MAKTFKSRLPKVISKANKDISTIIENDIIKESALLKDLVDQVLKANLEVKKKNNQRITETKRKLAQLDEEITDLNVKIDLVDRETVIQQLNEMIDAENKIFNARQEIRFFDNEQLPERIDTLNDIYNELTTSAQNLNEQEEQYRDTLVDRNGLLLRKQLEVTKEIIHLMDDTFTTKQENVQGSIADLYSIREKIITKEKLLNDTLSESIENYQKLILESSSTFSEVDNDEQMTITLEETHIERLKEIKNNKVLIEETFESDKEKALADFKSFESTIIDKFESSNQSLLAEEQKQETAKDDRLRQIRFEIMNAEKLGNIEKITKLMKEFDKVEKSSKAKVSKKVQKQTKDQTGKQRLKVYEILKALELKREKDLHNEDYENAFEAIRYEEAKILHKIQGDHTGLQSDVSINQKRVENLKQFLADRLSITKEINEHKLNLRLGELTMLQENEYSELHLIENFKTLLLQIKEVERKRNAALKQSSNAHEIIRLDQDYKLKKSIEDIKLDQETSDIDKLILRKRNETLIINEKLKEEMNSEVIYQESLIKIAQKEHELQLIKVKSLYENERSLAEEQVERINLGVQVNDTFVKTTLQNQLLFATQQINCAESEFEIRVESVNLTHDQEVHYANKKIEYYRQKYEYDKSKHRKESEDKLEDLNYKLLLFTDEKDHKEITEKIQVLNDYYDGLVDEIEEIENSDPEILRYEKVINDADNRAKLAIDEAQALREQTSSSFQALYDATKQKYDLIEEENQTEETRGIMPLLNNSAISSADERLKLAMKEADELYHERIDAPKIIIEETLQKIEEVTNSDETEKFIDEQKILKKDKLKSHKEATDRLLHDKVDIMRPLLEEIQRLQTTNEESPILLDLEKADYRTKEDIERDYNNLSLKEKEHHSSEIKMLTEENKQKQVIFDLIHKDTSLLIKKTFKPYKTYIKKASKDVNRKKKNLRKDHNKKLKKRLNETDKRLKEMTI